MNRISCTLSQNLRGISLMLLLLTSLARAEKGLRGTDPAQSLEKER
jgi:hypothetical protein